MYHYGATSLKNLRECHPELQRLFFDLESDYNISILEGHRPKAEQGAAFNSGNSKVQWPDSKHNEYPSKAVDAAIYPGDWNDSGRHYMFVGIVRERARALDIPIRCGADWDGDFSTKEQTFNDLVHSEYIGDK